MAGEIKVNAKEFTTANSALQGTLDDMTTEFMTIQNTLQALLDVWNGKAKTSFQTGSSYVQDELYERIKEIQQLQTDVTSAQAQIEQADAELAHQVGGGSGSSFSGGGGYGGGSSGGGAR